MSTTIYTVDERLEIGEAAQIAIRLVRRLGRPCTLLFKGTLIQVDRDETCPEDIVQRYMRQRRAVQHAARRADPEMPNLEAQLAEAHAANAQLRKQLLHPRYSYTTWFEQQAEIDRLRLARDRLLNAFIRPITEFSSDTDLPPESTEDWYAWLATNDGPPTWHFVPTAADAENEVRRYYRLGDALPVPGEDTLE